MPSSIIQVKYVNQPAPGKKQGTVKTPDDTIYGVKPAMLGLFQPGSTYEVQYEDREFQGRIYHTIVSVKPAAPAPQQNGGQRPLAGYDDTRKSEQIWVQGLIQAAAQADPPQVNIAVMTEVVEVGRALRDAYRLIFNVDPPRAQRPAQQQQQQQMPLPQRVVGQQYDPELNDEIPM